MTRCAVAVLCLIAFITSRASACIGGLGGGSSCDCQTQPMCCRSAPAASSYSYDASPSAYVPPPASSAFGSYGPPPAVGGSYGPPPPAPYAPVPVATASNNYGSSPLGYEAPASSQSTDGYNEAAAGQRYPAEEYRQMLSGIAPAEAATTTAPSKNASTSKPTAAAVIVDSASKTQSKATSFNVGDQTAYRSQYEEEHAVFESASHVVPPPADEEDEDNSISAEVDSVSTVPSTSAASTASSAAHYVPTETLQEDTDAASTADTTVQVTSEATTELPVAAAKIANINAADSTRVRVHASEIHKPGSFLTYANQVCTGIVLNRSTAISIPAAAHRCLELRCAAVNARPRPSGEGYDIVYLQTVDSRKRNIGFRCLSPVIVPDGGDNTPHLTFTGADFATRPRQTKARFGTIEP